MKPLRPSMLATGGPLLLGAAIAVGSSLAMPHSQELPGFGWLFAIGAAAGLAIFGPTAAILTLGQRHPAWLVRHSWRIGFYSSVAFGLSLGYLAACIYHGVSDDFMLAAFVHVFLGAIVKTALSYAIRQQQRNGRPLTFRWSEWFGPVWTFRFRSRNGASHRSPPRWAAE